MRDIFKRNPLAVVLAVVMHAAIIAFMFIGVDWLEKPVQPKSNVDIVQAKVVDQSKVDAEVARLKKAEDAKKAKEQKRLADIQRKLEKEKKKLAELERKRKAKESEAKAAEKKRAEAKKRAAKEKKRKAAETKKKAAAEKKRKAAAVKKKAAAEKERKAVEAKKKAAAEKERKAAEAKKRVEAEKKRKAAEAERQRKAAEAKRRAGAEKKRRAAEALAAEQKALEDALQAELESERMATERDQFIFAIKQKIQNNWLRPTTVADGLSCKLRVRLIPGGGVVSVTITRSSGSGAFDRSVETAVYKADPLPVPKGAGFEAFRDLNLDFIPSK